MEGVGLGSLGGVEGGGGGGGGEGGGGGDGGNSGARNRQCDDAPPMIMTKNEIKAGA